MTWDDHLVAAQSAARALSDLQINQARPVDPFEAIDTLRLELQFQPLRDILGAIVPGDNPGVLINSARPASVQRYTAAHEIGHWYMDQDELAIDTQEEIEGTPRLQRERRAQIFASHFLMPLDLLYATAANYRVFKGGLVAPLQAYQMARDMHVSYRAAVYQLANCKFINTRNRDDLLRVQPAQLKTALTSGRRPANTRGDVWAVDPLYGSTHLEVFVGDEIVVALPERPSTGYRWIESCNHSKPRMGGFAPAPFGGREVISWAQRRDTVLAIRPTELTEPALVKVADELDSESAALPVKARIGATGIRRIGFGATRPGTSSVELDYTRPFSSAAPVRSMQLNTHVRALPDVEERQRRLRTFAREELELGEGRPS